MKETQGGTRVPLDSPDRRQRQAPLSAPRRPAQSSSASHHSSPQIRRVLLAEGAAAADAYGALWWARIPGRIAASLTLLTLPLRAAIWVLDAIVAASVVGVIAVGWAWWTERITDDQVAQVLGRLGERGLSILSKSGVL